MQLFDIKNSSFIKRSSLMLGNILNAGLGFLTFGLLARGLSKDDFGIWVLYLSVFGFIEMLRAGFIYQALVKFIASCKNAEQEKRYILGAWQISTWLTLSILAIILLLKALFANQLSAQLAGFLTNQYVVVLCLMLPINMATMLFHAKQKFQKLWLINFLQSFPFLVYLFFMKEIDIQLVVDAHLIVRIGVLAYVLITEKQIFPQIKDLFRLPNKTNSAYSELMQFSRFTVFSTLGTNLLKSVDIWLINHFGGASLVAIYQIPLKLVEVFEIPLRTWAMSAYPKFSTLVAEKRFDEFQQIFKKEIKNFTFGMLPVIGICFHFSEELVTFYAGKGYVESVILLKLFLIYILLLPLDRYLGIALDSLNMPQTNTFKVFLMLFVNVLGDIFVLVKALGLAAIVGVTLINITFGIVIGLYFMKQQFNEKHKFVLSKS